MGVCYQHTIATVSSSLELGMLFWGEGVHNRLSIYILVAITSCGISMVYLDDNTLAHGTVTNHDIGLHE